MTWQISLALRGDLEKFLDAEVKAGKRSVSTVIRRRVNRLKNDLRRQIKRAGLSERLGKTVRGETYPKRGASLNAAGRVFSKAIVKRTGGIADLITLLDTGAVIKAGAGRALAIPLPAAGRGRGVKGDPASKKPGDFPDGTFRLVVSRDRKTAVLVFRSGPRQGEAAFILVRQVRLKKRINIERAYQKAIRGIDDDIVRQWERNNRNIQDRFGL